MPPPTHIYIAQYSAAVPFSSSFTHISCLAGPSSRCLFSSGRCADGPVCKSSSRSLALSPHVLTDTRECLPVLLLEASRCLRGVPFLRRHSLSLRSRTASSIGFTAACTGWHPPRAPFQRLCSASFPQTLFFLLYSRLLYASIHKPHHLWKLPTPFASHAFHPCDGVAQSMPCRPNLLICNTVNVFFVSTDTVSR